jgi:hypothetical protein
MGKRKGKWYYPHIEETKRIFGPGCYIDFENNTIYGADGKVYRNVQVNRADVERLITEEKAKKNPH